MKNIFQQIPIKLRQLYYAGPWQNSVVRYFQSKNSVNYRQNISTIETNNTKFWGKNKDDIITSLKNNHFATELSIPESRFNTIKECFSYTSKDYIEDLHIKYPNLNKIFLNPTLLSIISAYLKVNPILQSSFFVRTHKESISETNAPRAHRFHRDYADFLSLTLMIYLTDVDDNYGAHEIIPESYSENTFSYILKKRKSIKDIKPFTFTGKKGSAFLENTQLLHRRIPCRNKREILFVNYCLQRRSNRG